MGQIKKQLGEDGRLYTPYPKCERRKYKTRKAAENSSYMASVRSGKPYGEPEYCRICDAHHLTPKG